MNAIELVNKYLPVLDAQYQMESRSAILDTAPEFIQATRDAKKFKIAKIKVDGMATYSRHSGFVKGYADLTWEEMEYTQDRGRAIQIDDMDNEETFGLAFGRLAGEFQRLNVIPEIDAYRFSKYYKSAGISKTINLTSGNILKVIDDIDAEMDDAQVPEGERIIFMNPQVYKMMINDPELQKHISVEDVSDKTVNKKFYYYDSHLLIKVPSNRFYTDIDLKDGTTEGQEEGGYKPADGSSVIGMLVVARDAVIQVVKRRISRVWAPTKEQAMGTDGVNPDADAWKFDYRTYHDAFVMENKVGGIAGVLINSPEISFVTSTPGSYDSSTETFTKGATYNFTALGNVNVVNGTIPYAEADETLGLDAGNRLTFKLANSAITKKADLPNGNIVTIKGENTTNTYTKDAFEADGSLIVVCNTTGAAPITIKVSFFEGVETTYTYITSEATLAQE